MPFDVWAPRAERVEVEVDGDRHPMVAGPRGWFHADLEAGPGTDYAYLLDGDGPFPDPRSRCQPQGVDPPSRVRAPLDRTVERWDLPPLRDWIIYELHVGTFSPEGTYAGIVTRLDHLTRLGVNALELMPVNSYSGTYGWGYDGVGLYAPHAPYGTAEDLVSLVDACHERGIAVILDVVYNHLGPRGNHLARFGPYLTDRYSTPWGEAVNFDDRGSDQVRSFFIDNAAMWFQEFGFDALRIDAVHAMLDRSATHFLEELGIRIDEMSRLLDRPLYLIAESDLNDPRLIRPRASGGYGLDAQWSDDVHHAIHASLTGEREGYYADFGSLADVAAALTNGYVYTGQPSGFRGRKHGRSPAGLPGSAFVAFIQNHDQVGNRATGERLATICGHDLQKVGAALLLTSPYIPLLFMGEEWAASAPFQYFSSHPDPELGRAVTAGRKREFEGFGWDPDEVPDPQDPATFERSKLDWGEVGAGAHRDMLEWYRSLLRLREREPALGTGPTEEVVVVYDEAAGWLVVRRDDVVTAVNLSSGSRVVPVSGDVLLASKEPAAKEDEIELQGRSAVILRGKA